VEGRDRCGSAAGRGRGEALPCRLGRGRRRHRRLPRAVRPAGGPASGPRTACRLQPTRLALGHMGLRPRPLCARLDGRPAARAHRSNGTPRVRSRRGRHGAERELPGEPGRLAARPLRGLPGRGRGACVPSALESGRELLVRRKADPPPRARDHPGRGPPRPRPQDHRRRKRPARVAARAAPGERRLDPLDRIRAARRCVQELFLCARHLRHLAQGRPRDPEQGLPRPRVRNAGDHRGHAGRARASHRWNERATGRSGRPACAGGRDAGGGRRHGAARADRRRRPPHVPRALE
jgi:hypothetical protein